LRSLAERARERRKEATHSSSCYPYYDRYWRQGLLSFEKLNVERHGKVRYLSPKISMGPYSFQALVLRKYARQGAGHEKRREEGVKIKVLRDKNHDDPQHPRHHPLPIRTTISSGFGYQVPSADTTLGPKGNGKMGKVTINCWTVHPPSKVFPTLEAMLQKAEETGSVLSSLSTSICILRERNSTAMH
jgi:hypothetical protein